jgi:uncharacterized membrane protein HdeD (DUF308 family)
MLSLYARTWWAVGLRGLLSILFGVLVLIWPEIAVEALVLLFGAFVLVDGVFAIISAVRGRDEHRQWWLVLLEGIAGVAFGLVAVGWPRITALVLLLLIAGWAIATGILEIVAAILLRRELRGEGLLILSGILSLVLGVLLAIRPQAGAVAFAWLIGVYAILFGVLLIALAFRLRGWFKQIQGTLGQA